jgi:MerR family transcriptional regulator, light-induced transcriptional regulator
MDKNAPMDAGSPPSPDLHPVQEVCRLTGLSPDVLRVWERRYRAVAPRRSAGGHRLYGDAEVSRLRMLAHLVSRGRRIGTVAALDDATLAQLLAESDAHRRPPAGSVSGESVEACVEAALGLDETALDAALFRAGLSLGLERVLEEVHAPFLRELGRRWEEGLATPSHEHLASVRVRAHLLGFLEAQRAEGGPRLLATTPSGEHHELGALLAAVVAASAGWHVTYLGPDVPAPDVAAALRQVGARALLLSVVHPDPATDMREELGRLVAAMPEGVAVLAGGEWCALEKRLLGRLGIRHAASLEALRDELSSLAAQAHPA